MSDFRAEKLKFVCDDRHMREALDEARTAAVKYLTSASDPVMIHRAQGRVQLIDELVSALDHARNLR